MPFRRFLSVMMVALAATSLRGESVTGNILIKRRLTPRKVTASQPLYQRGVGVELAHDAPVDPIAFERSRVVVYLEGPGPSKPQTASMRQAGRRFSPDLVVVPAGSAVSFPNMDPIFHNVFSFSKTKAFDLGNYPKDDSRSVQFPRSGVVYVDCHLHPNMAGTIVVTPNAWFARVGAGGSYNIEDVPPGQYTIVAWHKAAGFFRKQIEVVEGRSAVADFFLPLDVEPPPVEARK